MKVTKIREIYPINKIPFHHTQEEKKGKKKKNFGPLILKGASICYNKLGQVVKHNDIKEYYNG